MQQPIRFKGLSLTPDEMAAENGALSLCGGVELHDGALRPSILQGSTLPSPLTVNGSVASLNYVHETSEYKHLIAVSDSAVWWFMQDGTLGSDSPIKDFGYEASILSINSIGNTLVIVATDGIHYVLWKKGAYHYLGQKPPFLDIYFGVSGNYSDSYTHGGGLTSSGSMEKTDWVWQQTTLTSDDALSLAKSSANLTKPGQTVWSIKEEHQATITESLYALLNRTNNQIAKAGHFYANFFVRYCYRLYDGSMFLHSAPVFIPVLLPDNYKVYYACGYAKTTEPADPYTTKAEITGAKDFEHDDTFTQVINDSKEEFSMSINKLTLEYRPRNVSLRYTIWDSGTIEKLKEWGDIVKSVDIFISSPITKIEQSEKVTSFVLTKPCHGLQSGFFESIGKRTDKNGLRGYTCTTVEIPSLSDSAYADKIKNTSAFFKVCSLQVEELESVSYTDLPVDKSAVYNASLQEQMKDDYKSHNDLFAEGSYAYNHRLNLYGMRERLFKGFNERAMLPYPSYLYSKKFVTVTKVIVKLNTTEGSKFVEVEGSGYSTDLSLLILMPKFYPDSRAEKIVFLCKDSKDERYIYSFVMHECNELNGAMAMGDLTYDEESYKVDSFAYTLDDMVQMKNKIYTSEADNPYYFPLTAINTVGIGTILGIASATRALSQGQFGQYPLMAFTTDGIWALNVSANGTYSSIHPISREVVSNVKSITQLDQSVLFTTDRSLNKIVESQVASVSEVLDGPYIDLATMMPQLSRYVEDMQAGVPENETLKKLVDFNKPPIDFFQGCSYIYDYKNSRILCISTDASEEGSCTVAFVYSIRDGQWSTMVTNRILAAVNSYPHPYIEFADGSVKCLDSGYDFTDSEVYDGIIVTRTLKFDEDEAFDALTGYVHSQAAECKPTMWWYGSNDNVHWHYIGMLTQYKASYLSTKSYRYFRIAMHLRMRSREQYMSLRLNINRKFGKI